MAVKLNKPVARRVLIKDINGVEGEVDVIMTSTGIQFKKGRRQFAVIPYEDICKLSILPLNIPARYSGNKIGWIVEPSLKKKYKYVK